MKQVNRILLVNDTRGAQEYLLRAFRQMGLECIMATFGWPTIARMDDALDFDPLRRWGLLGKVPRPFINLVNVTRLDRYDVASYVHRISFIDRPHILRFLDLPLVRDKVSLMSYSALGCDEIAFIAGNTRLPYTPCETCQRFDDPSHYCERIVRPMNGKAAGLLNKYFDCVVSTAVEYSHVESLFRKPVARIGLPVDVSEVPWRPSGKRSGPVRILHTPSRSGFKGTAIVLEAIERLRLKRKDFEFQVVSGLRFQDYIEVVGEADVIVDQVWSQSPGMNALWLLAMGKVVFSGHTDLAKRYLPYAGESPILDADPDPDKLAISLDQAISQQPIFSDLADRGRAYVSQHHGHIKIAGEYLSLWQQENSPARTSHE